VEWDDYFIGICGHVRSKSKDPSSKIGAVLVDEDHGIVSTGYNGFPRGVEEDGRVYRWARPLKYSYVEHAERNAIYNAARHGTRTKGCTLYFIGFGPVTVPCTDCTRAVIQSGIVRVVGAAFKPIPDGWKDSLSLSSSMLAEAGVEHTEATRLY